MFYNCTVKAAGRSAEECQADLMNMNATFHELYEGWLVLSPQEQANLRLPFLRAQVDFHSIGGQLLSVINPPVTFDSVQRASDEEQAAAVRLQFGTNPKDDDETATSATPTATETNATMDVDGSASSSDVSNIEQESSPKPSLVPTEQQLCQSKKEQTAEQNTPKLITEVMQLSYASYAELLRPVLNLPLIIQVDVKSINDVIKAITDVTTMADTKRVKLHQSVIRTIILLVLAKFDSTSKLAWRYELGNSEPTFDFLVSFLCKRKKDEDVQSSASAAVKDWKIPKNVNPVNDKPSTSGMANNKKAKNSGGVGRSITPSPVRNPNKKQKPSQNLRCPFGDGPHGIRECPKFMGMTLEHGMKAMGNNVQNATKRLPEKPKWHKFGSQCQIKVSNKIRFTTNYFKITFLVCFFSTWLFQTESSK